MKSKSKSSSKANKVVETFEGTQATVLKASVKRSKTGDSLFDGDMTAISSQKETPSSLIAPRRLFDDGGAEFSSQVSLPTRPKKRDSSAFGSVPFSQSVLPTLPLSSEAIPPTEGSIPITQPVSARGLLKKIPSSSTSSMKIPPTLLGSSSKIPPTLPGSSSKIPPTQSLTNANKNVPVYSDDEEEFTFHSPKASLTHAAAAAASPPALSGYVQDDSFPEEGGEDFAVNVLAHAGLVKKSPAFTLTVSRAMFVSHLRTGLKGGKRGESFMASLEAFVSHPVDNNLSLCLATVKEPGTTSSNTASDLNVIQLLLKVDVIQPKVVELVLSSFLFHALEEEAQSELPKRILRCLFWMDFLQSPEELTKTLVETIHALNEQNSPWLGDLVRALPEMITDESHGVMVQELTKVLKETRNSSAVICALSDLSIPSPSLKMELISNVLDSIQGKPLEDVPVIVNFLLSISSTFDKEKQFKVFCEMRQRLQFLDKPPKTELESTSEQLILKEVHTALLLHPALCSTFFEIFKQKDAQLQSLDVWLLFSLHRASSSTPSSSQTAVRECIKKVALTSSPSLFATAMAKCHRGALDWCGMENLCDLASVFLRVGPLQKRSSTIRSLGANLFRWLFEANLGELRERQSIVHALVSHCCPGQNQEHGEEVDSALSCLDGLVSSFPEALAPFSPYVRSLVNELDRFRPSQARVLLRIVSRLSLVDGEGMDELKIFLRKYIMSSESERQVLGILGTVQLAACLAPAVLPREGFRPDVREALSLLDNMLRETKHPFTFDELARVIESKALDVNVVATLMQTLEDAFGEWFLFDLRSPPVFGATQVSLNEALCFGLESEEETNGTSVKILAVLSRGQSDAVVKNRLSLLCPMLRAMHSASALMGNFQEVLLSCPLLLPGLPDCVLGLDQRSPLEKNTVCTSLFYACSWMRELISSFSKDLPHLSPESKALVLRRVGSLIEAERLLEAALGKVPQFVENSSLSPSTFSPLPKKKSGAAAAAKSSKKHKVVVEEDEEEEGEAEEAPLGEEEKVIKKSKSTSRSAPSAAVVMNHLRELSPETCRVLSVKGLKLVFESLEGGEEEFQASQGAFAPAPPSPTIHISALKMFIESSLKLLLSHLPAKSLGFGRKAVYVSSEDGIPLADLARLLSEHTFPPLRPFYEQICSRLVEVDVLHPSVEVTDALACISATLSLLSTLIQLEASLPPALLSDVFRCFTLEAISKGEEEGEELSFPLVLRTAYHFFVHTTAEARVVAPSLEMNLQLCCFLKDLVVLHNALPSVVLASEKASFRAKVGKFALFVLQQEWATNKSVFALRLGKTNVGVLLDIFHHFSKRPLEALMATADELTAKECLRIEDEGEGSTNLPSLTSKTFPIFYTAVFAALVKCEWAVSGEEEGEEKELKAMCDTFVRLVNFTRRAKVTPVVLREAIRQGRVFIDAFIKTVVPRLSAKLKRRQTFVISVLTEMQKATRQLQALITHGLTKKDSSILQAAPALRRSLESFLFSIKAMLADNNVLEKAGFFVGVLKARNLDGSLAAAVVREEEEEEE